jgi:hypothetical protein
MFPFKFKTSVSELKPLSVVLDNVGDLAESQLVVVFL